MLKLSFNTSVSCVQDLYVIVMFEIFVFLYTETIYSTNPSQMGCNSEKVQQQQLADNTL